MQTCAWCGKFYITTRKLCRNPSLFSFNPSVFIQTNLDLFSVAVFSVRAGGWGYQGISPGFICRHASSQFRFNHMLQMYSTQLKKQEKDHMMFLYTVLPQTKSGWKVPGVP